MVFHRRARQCAVDGQAKIGATGAVVVSGAFEIEGWGVRAGVIVL